MGPRLGGLFLRQVALLLHQPDDDRRALLGLLEVVGGGVARGRAQQARQHRRLGGRHLRGGLAEIALGRRLEAGRPGAEIGAVEIDRQDLGLGELPLQRQRRGDLLELALQRAGVVEPDELGHLLGQARPALDRLAGAQVGQRRAGGAAHVDAEMPVEAPVLGRDDRVDQMRAHVLGPGHAVLLAPPGEGVAPGVDQRDRSAVAAVDQLLQRRQAHRVIGHPQREHERHEDPDPQADPPSRSQDSSENASQCPLQKTEPGPGLRLSPDRSGHALV